MKPPSLVFSRLHGFNYFLFGLYRRYHDGVPSMSVKLSFCLEGCRVPNLLPRESVVLLPLVIGQSLRMKTGVKTRKVIVVTSLYRLLEKNLKAL